MYDRRDRSSRLTLPEVYFPTPKSEEDFRTYERLLASLEGVREMLEEYRSNEGRVGYGALNTAMACSKASIAYDVRGEEHDVEEAARYREEMENLVEQFQTATLPEHIQKLLGSGLGHAVAQVGRNQKLDMIYQEKVEAELVSHFFPVLTSPDSIEVPKLPTVRGFGCPVQAVIAGYQDLPLELSKRLSEYIVRNTSTINLSDHVFYYGRFLAIARSIYQKLEEFKGVPGYVIDNSFWRGSRFSDKQHRIQMLLVLHTENQERRLFQMKVMAELCTKLRG